jgi:hypothetical protein
MRDGTRLELSGLCPLPGLIYKKIIYSFSIHTSILNFKLLKKEIELEKATT